MEDTQSELVFADESDNEDVSNRLAPRTVAAVVSGTDWTTETIVSQLHRGNIQLNPRFQRRDAWKRDRKSRFIESLIVGLPIPQIVLAESKEDRGKFMVLDGKQRLLSILQFWGLGEGPNNAYSLSGLTLRPDLKRRTFQELSADPRLEADFDALCNQPIRTVVIRNWKDTNFLHTVFLRLNTGSVMLSPQELRQALMPGPYSDFIDRASGDSPGLRDLLGTTGPDHRMRDTEILARYIAFHFFANSYPGRMKEFLDNSFKLLNAGWPDHEDRVVEAVTSFEFGVRELLRVFGASLARKPESSQFNRAVFDVLIYFHSQSSVRTALAGKDEALLAAYKQLFDDGSPFARAIESDTAGAPNTITRYMTWAKALSGAAGKPFDPPPIPRPKPGSGAGDTAVAVEAPSE